MVRLVRFGLDLFRYDAVLFDEVHRFRPVAAIRHAPQDVLHELALEERVGIFDDHFQEIVGLFQFIVKREVVLRQLELVKAASFITRYALRIHHHIRRAALWDGPSYNKHVPNIYFILVFGYACYRRCCGLVAAPYR